MRQETPVEITEDLIERLTWLCPAGLAGETRRDICRIRLPARRWCEHVSRRYGHAERPAKTCPRWAGMSLLTPRAVQPAEKANRAAWTGTDRDPSCRARDP
jgi:hypothetical protein